MSRGIDSLRARNADKRSVRPTTLPSRFLLSIVHVEASGKGLELGRGEDRRWKKKGGYPAVRGSDEEKQAESKVSFGSINLPECESSGFKWILKGKCIYKI